MTARRSAPGGRPGSVRVSRGGSGTAAIACAQLASRRSTGSTWPASCSTFMAAGHRPAGFPWFEAPEPERVDAARVLLERLGALEGTTITPLGDQLRRFPCTRGSAGC